MSLGLTQHLGTTIKYAFKLKLLNSNKMLRSALHRLWLIFSSCFYLMRKISKDFLNLKDCIIDNFFSPLPRRFGVMDRISMNSQNKKCRFFFTRENVFRWEWLSSTLKKDFPPTFMLLCLIWLTCFHLPRWAKKKKRYKNFTVSTDSGIIKDWAVYWKGILQIRNQAQSWVSSCSCPSKNNWYVIFNFSSKTTTSAHKQCRNLFTFTTKPYLMQLTNSWRSLSHFIIRKGSPSPGRSTSVWPSSRLTSRQLGSFSNR